MKFEDQIRKFRSDIDADDVDVAELWSGIEEKLPTRNRFWWVAAAAAVVLVCVLTLLINPADQQFAETQNPVNIEQIDPETAREQLDLQQEYMATWTRLSEYEFQEADLRVFLNELEEINACEQELMLRLSTASNQSDVLRKVMDQYRKKIKVVQRMIRDLEKKKRNEKRKNEDYV